MRKRSIGDAVAIVALLLLVAWLLGPVIAQNGRTYAEAKCQANMRRLAEAIALYTADHQGKYPTNRSLSGHIRSNNVALSPAGVDAQANPIRFVNGVNWVEAIQPYVINAARSTSQICLETGQKCGKNICGGHPYENWPTLFRCPNAVWQAWPVGSTTARVTYVFNYALLECRANTVLDPSRLMMLREVDRKVNSLCRPINICTGSNAIVPMGALLNTFDPTIAPQPMDPNLHARNGSFIVFADGHVRHFTLDYFPARTFYTAVNCWDDVTRQWYNYGPNAKNTPAHLIKSIAITP